jgi:hypothetical protein
MAATPEASAPILPNLGISAAMKDGDDNDLVACDQIEHSVWKSTGQRLRLARSEVQEIPASGSRW